MTVVTAGYMYTFHMIAAFEMTNGAGAFSYGNANAGKASQETTRGRNGGTNELSDAVVNSNVGHVTSTLFPL